MSSRPRRRLVDLPIAAKVFLAPGFVLLALLILSAVAIVDLRDGTARIGDLSEGVFEGFRLAADAADAAQTAHGLMMRTLSIAANDSNAAKTRASIKMFETAADATAAALARLQLHVGPGAASVQALTALATAYRGAVKPVLEAAIDDAATATMLMPDVDTAYAALSAQLGAFKSDADRLRTETAGRAIKAANHSGYLFVGILIPATALSLLVTLVVSRGIARPILKLTSAMELLARGNLQTDIAATGARDEIGAMARAVQVFKDNAIASTAMAGEQARERAIKDARAAQLEALTQAFEQSAGAWTRALLGSAHEMRATAQSMSDIAANANQRATAVAEAADDASGNVNAAAAAAEQLSASIAEIGRQVAASRTIAEKAASDTVLTDEIVRSLSGATQRIGEVVHVISSIAGQTNLLALNATIEAARAGDAGRGFAVVAGEVKNLSKQTGAATSDIAQQIAAVQDVASRTVVDIQSISATISHMSAIAQEIAAAVEQQGMATREIAQNVQAAADSAQRVSRTILNVRQLATQTGEVAGTVLTAAGDMAQKTDEFAERLGGFLTSVRAA